MARNDSRYRDFMGPTVFSSHRASSIAKDEELIHYRPSAPIFGDRFLSEEEKERIDARGSPRHSGYESVVTKRNDLGQRQYSRYSSQESPNRYSSDDPASLYSSIQRHRDYHEEIDEDRRESRHGTHNESPVREATEAAEGFLQNHLGHHHDGNYRHDSNQPNDSDGSVEIYEDSVEARPPAHMTDVLHQNQTSPENEDEQGSRPPSFSFAEDELKKLRSEEERLKKEMRDAEENLRAIRQLRAERESRDSDGSDYTPRASGNRGPTDSVESPPSSRLSSHGSSSRPSDIFLTQRTEEDSAFGSPEAPPLPSPRTSLHNTQQNGTGGFPRAVLDEFQTALRRNASETPPVSPERAEAEFKQRVLGRKQFVNEESEAYIQSEREAADRMREAVLAPKEEVKVKRETPKSPTRTSYVPKTPREEYEERRRQAEEKLARLKTELSPEKFFDETPMYGERTGLPLPNWKREQIAKKRADRAYKDAEESIQKELEFEREHFNRMAV